MTGKLAGGSIRVLWDASDSAEVTITGGTAAWTVNGSAVTFPYTLASSTTFETAHSGTYTVSVQHHGHEVANTPDGTREVELGFGEQAVFEPTVDDTGGGQWMADLHRELSATYATRTRGVLRARGAVCFTWDDGFAAQDTIRQMADARGQRHTFAITSGLLNQANRMTNAQVLAAFEAGHEISSHCTQHITGMSDATLAQRIIDYDDSKAALEAIIGAGNVNTFTYTFGSHKRTTTTDKELYLRYDRVLNTGSNSGDSGSPYIYRRDEMVPGATPFLIGRFPWTSANHSRVMEVIRLAQRTPIIVCLYAHDPDTEEDPTMAQVTEAMDLCESLGIDCLTTEEAFPTQRILTDPGFEDPTLSAWHIDTAGVAGNLAESVIDTPASGMNGARSLHLKQVDASGTKYVYVAQQVPVTPGVSYTLSFKYRSNTTGASFTRPRARTRDYLGNVITQNQANLNNVQTTWADGSLVFTADATAVSVSVEFIINLNTGDAWFDHVHFGPTRLGVLG